MRDFIERIKAVDKRILIGITIFAIILFAIPLTLLEVQTNQENRQHAAAGQYRPDICGVHFQGYDVSPSDCHLLTAPNASGQCNAINSTPNQTNGTFSAKISMTSTDGQTHTVKIESWRFFCTTGALNPNTCGCADIAAGDNGVQQTYTVTPGSTTDFQLSWSNPPQYAGQSCGQFQYDYIINNIDGKVSCSSGLGYSDPAGFMVCQTGNNCTANTPTPTPTTPVDTPTPTLPVDTPTPTTPIDTPTPTTPVNTDTPTPTGTVTPQPSNTPTTPPTATNTPPPGATNTPTPIVNTPTPKPSLPPTGPGDTLTGIGVAGALLLIAGLAALAF